jgi:hypothetical protein
MRQGLKTPVGLLERATDSQNDRPNLSAIDQLLKQTRKTL